MQASANSCPDLTPPDLALCKKICDFEVQALASGRPGRSSLDLRHCSQISDLGVQALANSCPRLASFDLRGCCQTSGIDGQAFASGCPELASFVLRCYSQISGIGVQALANGCLGPASLNPSGRRSLTPERRLWLALRWAHNASGRAELQREALRQQGQLQEPDDQGTYAVKNQSLQLRHRRTVNGAA